MAPLLSLAIMLLVCTFSREVSGQEHVQLTLGVETGQYTAECNGYAYFQVETTDPCQDLRIQVKQIEGEPELYVSKGPVEYPTFTSLVWTSYEWGSETLTISSWDPEYVVGTYYIAVQAYCELDAIIGNTSATFTVLAEHVASTHPHAEIVNNEPVTGNIVADGYIYYRFCLPSSCVNVDVGLDNCRDPSTCPTTYSYADLIVSRSVDRPIINSHAWKLVSVDVRSVSLRHDDPDFYPGHYFVGVYGWCTPDDTCTDLAACGPCSYANNTEFTLTLTINEMTEAEGCTPKAPLEPCSAGGAITSSVKVLLLSLGLGWIIKTL